MCEGIASLLWKTSVVCQGREKVPRQTPTACQAGVRGTLVSVFPNDRIRHYALVNLQTAAKWGQPQTCWGGRAVASALPSLVENRSQQESNLPSKTKSTQLKPLWWAERLEAFAVHRQGQFCPTEESSFVSSRDNKSSRLKEGRSFCCHGHTLSGSACWPGDGAAARRALAIGTQLREGRRLPSRRERRWKCPGLAWSCQANKSSGIKVLPHTE